MRAHSYKIPIILFLFLFYSVSSGYAQPVPELSDTLIDFGVVPKSISHTKPFFVRNVGDATLFISNVIVSNPINFSASPTVLAIEPGDSGQVNVTLTPWWEEEIFATAITVVSLNAQPDSLYLEAIGEGVPDCPLISLSPMMLSATLAEGEQSVQQIRIQNIGSEPLYWSKSASDPVVRVTGGISPLDPFAWRDVDVTFPYYPVPPGEYHYTITFTSDDPYTPAVVVPVDLIIPGTPVAAADPDSLDFGLVYIGYPSQQTFTVTNAGTGTLHVSDITSDHTAFSAAPAAFALNSPNSQEVTVTCDPATAGVIDAALTVVSDDPVNPTVQVYATVTATDVTPPLLSVAQDTIVVTVPPGGRTNRMLVISNLGQGDLNWVADISPTGTEIMVDGMKVLVDDSRGYSGFFDGDAAGFIAAMTAQGAILVHNEHHLITDLMLALYDAVIITHVEGCCGPLYEQSELDAFRNFVLAGGGMMIHAAETERQTSMNALLASLSAGISYAGNDYTTNPWVTDFIDAEFTAEIDSVYQSGNNDELTAVPPGIVFADNDARIHGAYFENEGKVIVLANKLYANDDVNAPGADNLQLLLQMFTWLYRKVPGRSLAPEAGTTPGGSSSKLVIHFDATNLEHGVYGADIVLSHDGPGAVNVVVPTVMIVDSAATSIEDQTPAQEFVLHQNHPNPFNPSTTIEFETAVPGMVTLAVYDVSGRLVKVIVHQGRKAGRYTVTWDGTDSKGTPAASGVYFYRLQCAHSTASRKMVLLK